MDFQEIFKNLKLLYHLSPQTMMKLEDICFFWSKSSEKVIDKFKEISAKYQFENLPNVRRADSQTTHLQYWKDIGQFALTPALEDHDIDGNYIHFIEDFYGKVTFRKDTETPDSQLDDYYECLDRLFYTWVGFLWQKANGSSTGLPTCTVENNSVRMFYLNDFLFEGLSQFHDVWRNERIDGIVFSRDLEPIEVFARTNRNFKWKDREIVWELKKENDSIYLKSLNNVTSKLIQGNEDIVYHKPTAVYDNSPEVAAKHFIETCDSLLNDGWKLMEIKSR